MAKQNSNLVMLIDDDDIDNFINENIIKGAGVTSNIHIFKSGQSALEYLLNLQKNEELYKDRIPEMIFLDLNMPLMNGFQFLKEFEKLEEDFKKKMNIIILTSSYDPMDVKEAEKFPRVKKYLKKPLNEKDLEEI